MLFYFFNIQGFGIYITTVIISGTAEFSGSINYNPAYIKSIVDLFMWFSPLATITLMSSMLWVILRKRNKQKKTFRHKHSIFFLSAQSRFLLMMFVFWIQWFIPLIIDFMAPCQCVPDRISSQIYWLTFSVRIFRLKYLKFLQVFFELKLREKIV